MWKLHGQVRGTFSTSRASLDALQAIFTFIHGHARGILSFGLIKSRQFMKKIDIIILLVLCLTLLLLTGCVVNTVIPETTSGNLGNQENTVEPVIENTVEPVIWSGLGMGLYFSQESYIDTLLAKGFEELRIDIPDYQNTTWLNNSKAAVIRAVAKGAKVIWGVSSNNDNSADYTITTENWPTFRQAILDAAQWAQDNGVYEFQLGNEEENHIDGKTMTVAQIITNLKSVATDVQEIFTNGDISYSCARWAIADWVTAGRGDIDVLASNIYKRTIGNTIWQTEITALVEGFGVEHTYLSEFSLNPTSLDTYSTDEAVQAAGVTEMIEYIKASGITRALFYAWHGDEFGVVKDDETYRLLWNQALLNSGSVKSITVPAKTATISLPNTIALIPK
jgi:hypothetical protein